MQRLVTQTCCPAWRRVLIVLMETLQGVSYWYIDQCESKTNELLTVLGFLHICGQPYFTHVMCGAFYHPKSTRGIQNAFTLSMCVVAGLAFFMRYIFAVVYPLSDYIPLDGKACPNTEWIRASSLTVRTPACFPAHVPMRCKCSAHTLLSC